jgi:hypothetical protein
MSNLRDNAAEGRFELDVPDGTAFITTGCAAMS